MGRVILARSSRLSREGVVHFAVAQMRDMIMAQDAAAHIGSLPDLARQLGVGIVTVQQAARILEHEGFLEVRRGNGGGYYGARPDAETLSRAISAFLLVQPSNGYEAIEIMMLLDCDLMPAASQCTDEALCDRLRRHAESIDQCNTSEQRGAFEQEMHDILYSMVDRPLMETLARVTMRHYAEHSQTPLYAGADGLDRWKRERRNMVGAVLCRDSVLAEFEARRRRSDISARLAAFRRHGKSAGLPDDIVT